MEELLQNIDSLKLSSQYAVIYAKTQEELLRTEEFLRGAKEIIDIACAACSSFQPDTPLQYTDVSELVQKMTDSALESISLDPLLMAEISKACLLSVSAVSLCFKHPENAQVMCEKLKHIRADLSALPVPVLFKSGYSSCVIF